MKKIILLLTAFCLIISCGKSDSVDPKSTDPKPHVPDQVDPKPTLHEIGEFFQGGVIFWVDKTKQHGLIASTRDQGRGKWGTRYSNLGATLDGIGVGKINTEKITSWFGPDLQYAARMATSCRDGGYDDWYLPSKDELNLMLKQYMIIGGFDVVGCAPEGATYFPNKIIIPYWSSTTHDGVSIFVQAIEWDRITYSWVIKDAKLLNGITADARFCSDGIIRAIRSF